MNDVLKILSSEGVLDPVALNKVQDEVANGTLLEDALRSAAPEDKWLRVLASHYEVPYVELGEFNAPKEFLSRFPARVLLDHHLLPMKDEDGSVLVATSRLFDSAGLDELRMATGLDLRPVLAPTNEIDRAMKRLLTVRPKIDAVFAANDPSAIGAMKAIWEAGMKVPQDVAVVGVGDIALGDLLRVPLTTVGWSRKDEGRHAAELLLGGLDDSEAESAEPQRVIIPPQLIVRESCGAQRQ